MVKVLFFLPWSIIIVNTKKKSGYNNFLMKQLYEPFCISVFITSIYIGPKDFDIMRAQFNRSMSSSD